MIELMEQKAGKEAKETRRGFRRADYDSWQNSLRNFYRKKARARRFAKKAEELVYHYVESLGISEEDSCG